MPMSSIDAFVFVFYLYHKNSVWLALRVIPTRTEQTKKRTSSKQSTIFKMEKIKDRKRNSRITTEVKSCLSNSSGQVLCLKQAGLVV